MKFTDLDQCDIYQSEAVKEDLIYIKAEKTLPKSWSKFLNRYISSFKKFKLFNLLE